MHNRHLNYNRLALRSDKSMSDAFEASVVSEVFPLRKFLYIG